jgi:hypothetical protein
MNAPEPIIATTPEGVSAGDRPSGIQEVPETEREELFSRQEIAPGTAEDIGAVLRAYIRQTVAFPGESPEEVRERIAAVARQVSEMAEVCFVSDDASVRVWQMRRIQNVDQLEGREGAPHTYMVVPGMTVTLSMTGGQVAEICEDMLK